MAFIQEAGEAAREAAEQVTDPTQWREWGGLGLFAAGVLNTSILPVPGLVDALTLILSGSYETWWPYYAAMATAGSLAGGYLTYRIGRKGGKAALEKRFQKKRMERVYGRFDRWGFGAVAVPSLMPPPFPVMPFLLAAGAMKYPTRKYMLALTVGRGLRFAIVALLGSMYGRQILGFLGQYYEPLLYSFLGAAALGAILAVALYLRHRKNRGKTGNRPKAA